MSEDTEQPLTARRGRPVVLLYHVLADVPRALDPNNLALAPADLRIHVQRLRRRGYEFATVTQLAERVRQRGPTEAICALSFDDGSLDNGTTLPALLEELAVPATLFVCPGLSGVPHPFMAAEARVRLMTHEELRALSANELIELGSHTLTHAGLGSATPREAIHEMESSKAALEDLIGAPVESFAYPGCTYSPACPAAAEQAGYRAAVTCGPRGSWDPYEIKRASVDRHDGRLTYELKVRDRYWPLWSSAPGRLARAAAAPIRHRALPSRSRPR